MSIAIAGAGAFGTAMAIALSVNGPVTLWARDAEAATEMQRSRRNARRLPEAELGSAISVTSEFEAVAAADAVLLAVPAQKLRGFVTEHAGVLAGKALISCAKGIDLETLRGPAHVVEEAVPNATVCLLTGPSFAADIARGLPTALTLACADAEAGARLQRALATPCLRLYRTTDMTGAELGGALKNVIAIACGAAIGAGFGESARAALMTRGFAEMQRLATQLGARPDTLSGLAGFGDLTLTCTSDKSRNYRHGLALGQGTELDPELTVEGVATAQAAARIGRQREIDLPITDVVETMAAGRIGPREAMDRLLSRPLKEE